MVTSEAAAALALSFPEAVEKEHWGHPSYRVGERIYATLWPDERRMVLKLSFGDQSALCAMDPQAFSPVSGGWGAKGWTNVALDHIEADDLEEALATAWRGVAPKRLIAARSG